MSSAASLNLGRCQNGVLEKWLFVPKWPSLRTSVGSMEDLRTGGCGFEPSARPVLFPRTNDSLCDRTHAFLKAVHLFDDGYVEKQSVAWKEYCAEYWLKKSRKAWIVARSTFRRDIIEIMLKTALNSI